MSVPTPHNGAAKGDFAKTVLMPGDPLRARYIAETQTGHGSPQYAGIYGNL